MMGLGTMDTMAFVTFSSEMIKSDQLFIPVVDSCQTLFYDIPVIVSSVRDMEFEQEPIPIENLSIISHVVQVDGSQASTRDLDGFR